MISLAPPGPCSVPVTPSSKGASVGTTTPGGIFIYIYVLCICTYIHTYMHICIYVGICICHVCSVSLACSEGSEVGNKMAGRIQVELRRRQKLRTANLQEDNDTSDWS